MSFAENDAPTAVEKLREQQLERLILWFERIRALPNNGQSIAMLMQKIAAHALDPETFAEPLPQKFKDAAYGDAIPMLLSCPLCGARHIDEGEFATKIHHTHACQYCGMVWRPAIVPTVGVLFLPGFRIVDSKEQGDAQASVES